MVSLAVVVPVLAAVYLAGYFLTSDRVPRSTEVAGVDIGGLSPSAAQSKLADELGPRVQRPVTLVAGESGTQHQLDPAGAGLSLDAEATVDDAGGGRRLNPVRMWRALTGDQQVEPVLDVDSTALRAALTDVAADVDRDPVEGSINFADAEPRATYPETGLEVDVDAAAAAVQAAVLSEDRAVELPVDPVHAQVRPADVDAAMADFAEPAMSAPVTVRVSGQEATLRPRVYAPALSMRVTDGSLRPTIDEKLLRERARKPLRTLAAPARNATVRLRAGKPTVVDGQPGTRVDTAKLAEALLPVLTATGDDRVVELASEPVRPRFTTKEARALGIKEVVSSFTTYFPHSESNYRNINLGRAAEKINGTVLKPDDVFSLNGIVGERTAENGFTTGFIISDGALVEDYGGGVSQVATTVYNAAFFAGLEDVEHRPHSFYIDRYPMGREATVYWGALDLRFGNNTPYGVLVQSWIEPATPSSEGEMHVRMWSTQYWDKVGAGRSDQHNFTEPQVRYNTSEDCYPMSGHRGFDVDVFRYLHRGGERVDSQKWAVTYNPAPTVVCGPPPGDEQ
ncbi:MAG TPA: VanW family protein [Nocardioidaceae bacterium]|nr:VanW family protein [Nocardioidaceae bacterium]